MKGCVYIDKLQGQKNGSYIVTEHLLKEELNFDNIDSFIDTMIKSL